MGNLEIACFNARSAHLAAAAGAHRIELCADRAAGGITPSLALLQELRAQLPRTLRINVMIRPRGGDFVYGAHELASMRETVAAMKPWCDGFVFGVLRRDRRVDVAACEALVRLAEPAPCTFHRAVDETVNLGDALSDVSACGFKAVLTSGGPGDATDNMSRLAGLMESRPGNLVVMPGGGIRAVQIATFKKNGVDAEWFHSSAIVNDGEIADEQELHALCLAVRAV